MQYSVGRQGPVLFLLPDNAIMARTFLSFNPPFFVASFFPEARCLMVPRWQPQLQRESRFKAEMKKGEMKCLSLLKKRQRCPRNNPFPTHNILLLKSLWTELDFMATSSHREAGEMGLNIEMTDSGLSGSITWNWTQNWSLSASKRGAWQPTVCTPTERPASQQGSGKGRVMIHARLRCGKGLRGTQYPPFKSPLLSS